MVSLSKFTQLSLFSICCLVGQSALAQTNNLPFVGMKSYNFAGGNGTSETITIEKNGLTTIKLYGTVSTATLYKGQYKDPIPMDKGEFFYKITGNKIMTLDKNKKLEENCSVLGRQDQKCIDTLEDGGP